MMPFVIGRASSIRALEHALAKDKRVFLAAQHDASVDDPKPDAICTMGCVANVAQSLKLPDGNIKGLVEGIDRARAHRVEGRQGLLPRGGEGPAQPKRYQRRRRRDDEPRGGAVRTVREAIKQPAL